MPRTRPLLLDALARLAREHPLDRKLVVAPEQGVGRELLRALSREGRGWIGFEVMTSRPLALRIGAERLRLRGLRLLDLFAQQALLDEALDGAVAAGTWREFSDLSEGVGFREHVHGAVSALRLAGVGAGDLERARFRSFEKRRFLGSVLARYEALLSERSAADTATAYEAALETLEDGGDLAELSGADHVALLSGLGARGLAGRLLGALAERGARLLETDPVAGLDAPTGLFWRGGERASARSCLHDPEAAPADEAEIELFHASSPTAELREVLRRARARGLRWDQVEIVATDPAVYGSAMHALATRLGIPVTYAVGLPVERTRTGRVVATYFDWIEEGFQAAPIRRLLESGDLRPPGGEDEPLSAALARRFRSLRVGWGRERYRAQLAEAKEGLERAQRGRHEPEEAFTRRRERTRAELEALESILLPTLEATPRVGSAEGEEPVEVSAAELAVGLSTFLERSPTQDGPDGVARRSVELVLARVGATLRRKTDFAAAVTVLRGHLAVRVPAPDPTHDPDEAGAPWSSEGRHLHLSDLEHGGYACREAVFVVGADADRLPGARAQDPLLLDSDRSALAADLPLSTDLLAERRFRFAALVARLRGFLCLSYSAWDASEARQVAPSSALLQALRLAHRDAKPTFRDLKDELGKVASVLPAAESAPLDTDDVWMGEIGAGGVLRSATDAVRQAYPELDRGLAALRERTSGNPGPHHGVVEPRPELLDPRRNDELVVSASRLEHLGTCPLRYLHRSVLRAYPPDDFELDPDVWLDPLRRGSLLHAVFEESLRAAREEGLDFEGDAFEELVVDRIRRAVRRARHEVPSPGEGTSRREAAALEADGRSFARMVRRDGAPWVALELRFGVEGEEPLLMRLSGGDIRLRGAVDRVDDREDGLHVVDYKTGRVWGHQEDKGAFYGGRRLQHAIYSLAAEDRLDGHVVAGEYHFPTGRGENDVRAYPRAAYAAVDALVDHMLDGAAEGRFVPTDEPEDCKLCDYAEVCRVRTGEWGRIASPPAQWSKECLSVGLWPQLTQLRAVRTFED